MHRPALGAIALSTTLAVMGLTGPAAGAANTVGPGQAFVGEVTGSFSDATVIVICPGPAAKGHPAAGQQMEVLSPPPPVAFGIKVSVGMTGTAGRAIVARFRDDTSVTTTFREYFVPKSIPTGLLLPCSGTGKVVFRPVRNSPTARSSVVAVHYVNPAVTPVSARS